MGATQSMNVTIPSEMADLVREKVRSGEYTSESDVINEGLRSLLERELAVEQWLVDEVTVAYDEVETDPSAVTSPEVTWRKLQSHMDSQPKSRSGK